MLLYLVVSAPLFVLALCFYYRVTELRFSAFVFVRGILVAAPLLLLWWLLTWSFRLSYGAFELYQHYLFTQYMYPLLPGLVVFYLLERAVLRRRGHVYVVSLGVFLGGIYFVHSIVDVLRIPHYYGPYVAFILPTLRIALISVVPPLLGAASREAGPLRFVWAAAVVILPGAFAGIAVLHEMSYFLLGYLSALLATGLSVALHFFLLSSYYPRRPRAFATALGRDAGATQAWTAARDEDARTGEEGGEDDGDDDDSSGPGTRLFPNSPHE